MFYNKKRLLAKIMEYRINRQFIKKECYKKSDDRNLLLFSDGLYHGMLDACVVMGYDVFVENETGLHVVVYGKTTKKYSANPKYSDMTLGFEW